MLHFEVSVCDSVIVGNLFTLMGTKCYKFIHIEMRNN